MSYKFKIVMIGDFAVGKTSLVQRFVENIFSDTYLTTIGVKISKKNLLFDLDGIDTQFTLILWDISGDNGFEAISGEYLKGAHGAIIVGDLSRKATIKHIKNHMEGFQKTDASDSVIIALNKIDLADDPTVNTVSIEESKALMPGVPESNLFLTSAKDGRNVDEMFHVLCRNIVKNNSG